MYEYFNYNEIVSIFKFGWIFLFFEGRDGFVVKLVAAIVIRQYMYFFTLSYFLYNNLGSKKKLW